MLELPSFGDVFGLKNLQDQEVAPQNYQVLASSSPADAITKAAKSSGGVSDSQANSNLGTMNTPADSATADSLEDMGSDKGMKLNIKGVKPEIMDAAIKALAVKKTPTTRSIALTRMGGQMKALGKL